MERSRARNLDWVPEAETARYFSQRAGANLIVTGSIAISEWARTWAFEPGLYTAAQIEGWQRVTREVHDHGGGDFRATPAWWPREPCLASAQRSSSSQLHRDWGDESDLHGLRCGW